MVCVFFFLTVAFCQTFGMDSRILKWYFDVNITK